MSMHCLVDVHEPYSRYVATHVRRTFVALLAVLLVGLTLLPLLVAERYGSLDALASALAGEARTQRAERNIKETTDEQAARQSVSNFRACADGTSLAAEIGFAQSRGRLGSRAEYAGTYVVGGPGNGRQFRVHIVYRVGAFGDAGHEADYMFDYDVVTGAVSAANEIGVSYLRALETDCRRR